MGLWKNLTTVRERERVSGLLSTIVEKNLGCLLLLLFLI